MCDKAKCLLLRAEHEQFSEITMVPTLAHLSAVGAEVPLTAIQPRESIIVPLFDNTKNNILAISIPSNTHYLSIGLPLLYFIVPNLLSPISTITSIPPKGTLSLIIITT